MRKGKAKPADSAAVEKLRQEAARQRQAARIGELLRQLAAASEDDGLLSEMVDEIASWSLGNPMPSELDTSWGLGAVMAALANELSKLRRTAGDEQFSDLLADLQADLPELWQAAHADPVDAVIGTDAQALSDE